MKHALKVVLITLAIFLLPLCAKADSDSEAFLENPAVYAYIKQQVITNHFKQEDLINLFKQAKPQPSIITSMKKPMEKKPWYFYRQHFLTEQRIQQGLYFWHKHEKTLAAVEKTYGVPANIIVAIIGVETQYGANKGKYRVMDALSTLAFNYPARANYFKSELTHFLLLTRDQKIHPLSVYGSYAGAIGFPQFMPSSYRHYAVGYVSNDHIDLANNTDDAIASVGNYLQKNGWQANQPIAVPTQVKSIWHWLLTQNKKPKRPISHFAEFGLVPSQPIDYDLPAMLVKLKNEQGNEYWLGLNNFYVITRYNTSSLYAMAVYQLGQKIQALHDRA